MSINEAFVLFGVGYPKGKNKKRRRYTRLDFRYGFSYNCEFLISFPSLICTTDL